MKKKLFLRMTAMALSALLLLGLMPFGSWAAEEGSTAASLEEFNNPKGKVEDYSTDVNPYGYGDGQIFTMSTQDELFFLRGADINKDSQLSATIYSQFVSGSINDNNIAEAKMSELYSSVAGASVPVPFRDWNPVSGIHNVQRLLYNMQAVAFDPFNSGRNDHIAVVGVSAGYAPVLYIIDANDQKVVATHVITNGINTGLTGNDTQAFQASNLIAITAGRYTAYDPDKPTAGETLVIYFPDMVDGPELYEFSVTKSGSNVSVNYLKTGSSYLHSDYMTGYYGKKMQKEEKTNNHLAVSLATGDFNGDRIDDLAVLSSVTDPNKDYKNMSYQYFMPELYVAYGGGSGTILNRSTQKQEIAIWSEDKTELRSFTSPSVTAGDADGDGVDDIITAGWQLKVVKKSSSSADVEEYKLQSGVTVGIWKGLGKKLSKLVLKNFDEVDGDNEAGKITNHWTEKMKQYGDDNFNDTGEGYIFPQYSVEAVAIDGDGNADYIFMNGTFCKFDKTQGLAYVHTPEYFQHADSYVEGTEANAYYIASAAVGVFDKNDVGREQIIVSVGVKEKGTNDYFYMLGTMGGYNYNDKKDSQGNVTRYGTAQKIYSTAFDRGAYGEDEYDYGDSSDYPIFNKGNGTGQHLNCLVTAVDIGDDGVLARYQDKELIYTDPNIVAVLQAAPYFEELTDTEGATTYTFGTEYTIGEMSSESVSFSIGVSAEVEVPGLRVAASAGYTASWSESFEASVTESYSTTYTAEGNNQVVIRRTPVVVYHYDVMNDGKWDKQIHVSIPADPLYMQLTIDEYNAYVEFYNEEIGYDRLKPINNDRLNSASLLGNEGKPEKYLQTWTEIGGKNLSKSTYGLSPNDTGSMTSEFSANTSETKSEERSDGFYTNLSVGSGATFLIGSAYAGVDTSVEGSWSGGTFTTTTDFTAASGTVTNLGSVDSVPSNIREQYGFSWTFGRWNMWLDNANGSTSVPVFGYQVSSVRRPLAAPGNLTADDGEAADTVVLSWDTVEGAIGYNVYSVDLNGALQEIGKTTEPTFTYSVDSRTRFYSFQVSAIKDNAEGALSDKVIYWTDISGLNGQDGITPQLQINSSTNEWEVSYDGGATWSSLGVQATGDDGADGKDGKAGKDGLDGVNGKDGISPQFRINPETNIWELSYDEGVTWTSLEIEATGENGEKGETGATGEKGADGQNGITPKLRIHSQTNEWEVSYDGGTTWISLGVKATGQDGKDGADGKDGKNGTNGADGTDGKDGASGTDGADGKDGANGTGGSGGAGGLGIKKLEINENGELVVTMTDDTVQNLGRVVGFDGLNGKDGKDGRDGAGGSVVYVVMGLSALLGNAGWLAFFLGKKRR